jgi:hypothetical protein
MRRAKMNSRGINQFQIHLPAEVHRLAEFDHQLSVAEQAKLTSRALKQAVTCGWYRIPAAPERLVDRGGGLQDWSKPSAIFRNCS